MRLLSLFRRQDSHVPLSDVLIETRKKLAQDAALQQRAASLAEKQAHELKRRALALEHGLTVNQIVAIEETRDRRMRDAEREPITQPRVIPYPVRSVR